MTRIERSRYEMFMRVRNFGKGQRERFPEGSEAAIAFEAVAAAAAQIEAHALSKAEADKAAKSVVTPGATK